MSKPHPADLANIARRERGDEQELVAGAGYDPRTPGEALALEQALAETGDLELATALVESHFGPPRSTPAPPAVGERLAAREAPLPRRTVEEIEVIMLDGTRVVNLGGRAFQLTEAEMQKVMALAMRGYERDVDNEIRSLREKKLVKRTRKKAAVASTEPSGEACG